MHPLCINEVNGGHIGATITNLYCGVTNIVEEVLIVSGYCWDKINIVRIENYQQWPHFSLKFACE